MALLGSFVLDSIAASVLLVIVIYLYGTANYGYFKKRGVPYLRPLPFVGNFGSILFGQCAMNEAVAPLYNKLKQHKFGGVFLGRTPSVLVCDPEMVKSVLTSDFSSLYDRSAAADEAADPLSSNLFGVSGARWKNLRSKLVPVFTSGKLKQMLPLMSECSQELSDVLREKAVNAENIELKDVLLRYSADVIGTCVFGIQCHCLKDPQSEFFVMSKEFFSPSIIKILKFGIFPSNKFLEKIIPFKKLFPKHREFFTHMIADTIKYRKENNVERNDLVQMMMQLQKNDENKTQETHPDEVIFTDNVIAAQALIFFIAGQDGIASIVGFALHHLSIDTRIQDDLADEIHSVVSDNNNEITYEGIKQMKLLNMVVSETFRLYCPGFLLREVTVPYYKLPGTELVVEKGVKVLVPVYGLHYDPDIYPDPEHFDPYRFTEEVVKQRHPFTYLPFGEGPRVCIANRFALLEIKLCLASLIRDFKFSVCSETQIPIKIKTLTPAVTSKDGFTLKIEERRM